MSSCKTIHSPDHLASDINAYLVIVVGAEHRLRVVLRPKALNNFVHLVSQCVHFGVAEDVLYSNEAVCVEQRP